jgi:hypothetical protein
VGDRIMTAGIRAKVLGVAAATALMAAVAIPASVRAATVSFGTPTATVTFGKSIVYSQPISGSSFESADIVIKTAGDLLPNAYPIEQVGSSGLTYTYDNTGTTPFEPIDAYFQVIFSDGTVQQGPTVHIVNKDDRFTWKSKTSGVLSIYYLQGTDSFANQLLTYGVNGIAKVSAYFGISETKHIDFYIYPSAAVFTQGLNVPDTVGGQARPEYRTAFAEVGPGDLSYGSQVVPHELAHIVFSDAVNNPYGSQPDWLNEGLAVYLSQGYDSSDRQLVKQAASKGTLLPLATLRAYFFLDSSRIYQSYAEAVSAVDFLVRTYGQGVVQKLIKAYNAGSTDAEAFQTALGMTPEAFDKAWMADNGVTLPSAYGPQPAPTGALPPGWTSDGSGSQSSGSEPPSSETSAPSAAPLPTPGLGHNGGSTNDPTSTVMTVSAVIASLGVLLLIAAVVVLRQERRRQIP